MHDAGGVSCAQCASRLRADLQHLVETHSPAPETIAQGLALHVFHGNEMLAVGLADLVNR